LEALFLSADLLLSVELAESVPAVLFFDFDLDPLALSAAVELSAASVLLLLDLVLLPLLAAESVPLCAESLAVVFFLLLFFLAVVELSAWSCEPDDPACCALVLAAAHKSSQAARTARIAPLRDLIFRSLRFFGVCGQTYSSGTGQKQPPKGPNPSNCYCPPPGKPKDIWHSSDKRGRGFEGPQACRADVPWQDERIILKLFT
jgi:hypothetical protein